MEKPGKPLNNETVLELQVQPGTRKLQLFIPELAAASQPLRKSRDSSCFRCMGVQQDAFIKEGCGACPGDCRGHGINWILPALSLIDPSWGGNFGFLSIFSCSVTCQGREVRCTHVICKLAVKYFVWYNKSCILNLLCITFFSFEGNVK